VPPGWFEAGGTYSSAPPGWTRDAEGWIDAHGERVVVPPCANR
jgi:hypothetical protein